MASSGGACHLRRLALGGAAGLPLLVTSAQHGDRTARAALAFAAWSVASALVWLAAEAVAMAVGKFPQATIDGYIVLQGWITYMVARRHFDLDIFTYKSNDWQDSILPGLFVYQMIPIASPWAHSCTFTQ